MSVLLAATDVTNVQEHPSTSLSRQHDTAVCFPISEPTSIVHDPAVVTLAGLTLTSRVDALVASLCSRPPGLD